MNPATAAWHAWHDPDEPPGMRWETMLRLHLFCPWAWVISTPTVFACARYVGADWSTPERINPFRVTDGPTEEIHLSIAAGDMRGMWALLPPGVRWVSWQRRGYRLHRWPVARLSRVGFPTFPPACRVAWCRYGQGQIFSPAGHSAAGDDDGNRGRATRGPESSPPSWPL